MSDEELKRFLCSYAEAEMSLIDAEKYQKFDADTSEKYKKKIKKLISTEKYFGKHIYIGYALRWVAIITLCILSLAGVNQVSAKVFGFNPWKYIVSYISDVRMEQKTYTHKEDVSKTGDKQIHRAKRDVPNYVPIGLVEVQSEKEGNDFVFVMWQGKDEEHIVHYGRNKVVEGMASTADAEYEKKEKCVVAGYETYFYQKDKESWIEWTDKDYLYQIFMKNMNNPKKELLKMSESIYK